MVFIPFAFPAYVFTGYPFGRETRPFFFQRTLFLLEVVKYNTSTTLFLKNRETSAGDTGVEPAPNCVTGRHLNRLTYRPKLVILNKFLNKR